MPRKIMYWLRQWFGAIRQQAITRANVDPDLRRGVTRPQQLSNLILTIVRVEHQILPIRHAKL